jgi:hypothetical protein
MSDLFSMPLFSKPVQLVQPVLGRASFCIAFYRLSEITVPVRVRQELLHFPAG